MFYCYSYKYNWNQTAFSCTGIHAVGLFQYSVSIVKKAAILFSKYVVMCNNYYKFGLMFPVVIE